MFSRSLPTLLNFLQGVIVGLLTGGAVLLINVFLMNNHLSLLCKEIYQWLLINLGFSAVLFTLILIVYGIIWRRIHLSLRSVAPETWKRIIHDEQLLEMLTSLAFGIGVIWTAIGMREALIAAFGDNAMTGLATQGALVMLEQLINGGILTALTSTVVGGLMGYVLRIFNTLTLSSRLNDYQEALSSLNER